MPTIYILCGFSFSGKTTWANSRGIKAFHYDDMKYVPERAGRKMEDFMECEIRKYGGDCVLDHTNWSEQSILSLCKRYSDYKIILVLFDISFSQIEKNRLDSKRKIKLYMKTTKQRFDKFRTEIEKIKKLTEYEQIIITDDYYNHIEYNYEIFNFVE